MMTQPLDPDNTPEWLKNISLMTALGNLVFDIGAQAAKLTMLHQRAADLHKLITQEVNDGNSNDSRPGDSDAD